MNSKKCVFAGSFDPFIDGHFNIVKRAAAIFDEVHVLIAVNSKKVRNYNIDDMKEAMKKSFELEGLQNVVVATTDGLVVKYCAEHGIRYSVRGIRNSIDFDYEENIKLVNKEACKNLNIPELEMIYFPVSSTYEQALSSTTIREFIKHGLDVSKYMPKPIADIVCK